MVVFQFIAAESSLFKSLLFNEDPMISEEQVEEIDLSQQDDITLFTDDEHIVVKHVNFEFVQHSKMKGEVREFTVFNDVQCFLMLFNEFQ